MSVRFDAARAERDFRAALIIAMKQLQQELLDESQGGMKTPEGRESLHLGDIEETATLITAEVVGGAWAAMDEWGTGSLMDTSNPAYPSYRASELWNPARHDTAIRGRPAGEYTDIFGQRKTSTGKRAGRLLEKSPKFAPQAPSHAMRDAMRWMENGRMQEVLSQLMATFPWGKYIVVGR